MMTRCWLWCLLIGGIPMGASAAERPNVVFILIDDLGYADLSCTGNRLVSTPHIDRLASEGTLFSQFHVNSPICSPSRVAFTTGQSPQRYRIHSYLNSREMNRRRGMADFLDPQAPCIARAFREAGYATAHFGKWHMGGGRDVDDAPLPQAYGFDESLTSFEGLGDRILPPGGLSKQSAQLGRGNITWVEKHEQTGIYVDRTIDFIERHRDDPFYVHVWLNDVHDAHQPAEKDLQKYADASDNAYVRKLCAVLDRMDRELGRLFAAIDRHGLADRTLILLTGDNGPTAWPRYYTEGVEPPGDTGGDRGRKWSLYQGGIRQPLIVRWRGKVPAGRVDDTTVLAAVDFFPTLTRLAGVTPPDVDFDGDDMSAAWLGKPTPRQRPVCWRYDQDLKPGLPRDVSPLMAIRDGSLKLLMNPDGSQLELYDLTTDPAESRNLAAERPEDLARLRRVLETWNDEVSRSTAGR